MRPIKRCLHPVDKAGNPKIVSDYKDWRLDLIHCFGAYCAYCNDTLAYELNVEHQVAQSLGEVNPLAWDNLLLSCGPCNWAKNDANFTLESHYFPDIHNTYIAFDIEIRPHKIIPHEWACIPIVNTSLNANQQEKAQTTLNDLALQRVERDRRKTQQATDLRWQRRYETYLIVETQYKLWLILETERQIEAFLETLPHIIVKSGFFSLWYHRFKEFPQIIAIIIEVSKTDRNAFDENYHPIPRTQNDL